MLACGHLHQRPPGIPIREEHPGNAIETEAVSPDPTLIGGALASRSSKVSGEVLGRVGRGNSTKSAPETARLLYLPLCGLATDLDTEHGGTDANKRDAVTQLGQLNIAGLRI